MDEEEEFKQVPLPKARPNTRPSIPSSSVPLQTTNSQANSQASEAWAHQDLSRFKIQLPPEDELSEQELAGEDLTRTSIAFSSGLEEVALEDIDKPDPRPVAKNVKQPAPFADAVLKESQAAVAKVFDSVQASGSNLSSLGLSQDRAEAILKEQIRDILENVAWKIIPDIAERVIRDEIQKLLKETDKA